MWINKQYNYTKVKIVTPIWSIDQNGEWQCWEVWISLIGLSRFFSFTTRPRRNGTETMTWGEKMFKSSHPSENTKLYLSPNFSLWKLVGPEWHALIWRTLALRNGRLECKPKPTSLRDHLFVTVILFTDSKLMEEPCCSKIGHVMMFLFSIQCSSELKINPLGREIERKKPIEKHGGRRI